MSLNFETAVKQEEAYLSVVHPNPEDVPSCISLLDEFLRCNALGSQVRTIYRYGHSAHCGPKFEDFKVCLSLKGLTQEERRVAWIRRRAEWWARRRMNHSSEDVWEMRTEPLRDFPPPPASLSAEQSTGIQ